MRRSTSWTRAFALAPLVLVAFTARAQSSVGIPGSYQSEVGCPGDWQPECALTHLTEVGAAVWRGAFQVPAGNWEYKAALNDSWNENYGANAAPGGANIPLNL